MQKAFQKVLNEEIAWENDTTYEKMEGLREPNRNDETLKAWRL